MSPCFDNLQRLNHSRSSLHLGNQAGRRVVRLVMEVRRSPTTGDIGYELYTVCRDKRSEKENDGRA